MTQIEGELLDAVRRWRATEQEADAHLEQVRALVRSAFAAGMTRTEIHRLTGISRTAINDWIGILPPGAPRP